MILLLQKLLNQIRFFLKSISMKINLYFTDITISKKFKISLLFSLYKKN